MKPSRRGFRTRFTQTPFTVFHEHALEREALRVAADAMRAVVVGSWPSRRGGERMQRNRPEPDGADEPEELADIEKERQRNIARNQEVLRHLGLA